VTPLAVIQFWRDEVGAARWFVTDAALDAAIRARYAPLWEGARTGALDAWQEMPEGALALVIVLDQFPRNMFRGSALAFASDPQALAAAKRAVANRFDLRLPTALRQFLYMPFMHTEDLASQDRCVALFLERLGPNAYDLPYAREHRAQISRFGRFPARNAALGRDSTEVEIAYLQARANR